jgi:hypothetical protein
MLSQSRDEPPESITSYSQTLTKIQTDNENLILGLSRVSAREWHHDAVTLFKVRHANYACIYRYATNCLRTDRP